ncbi:14 kDa phosphohistidine phosphatase isoform 2-T2 [Alca torda]
MAAALSRVPEVEIDGGGVFKYVLVRVRAADGPGKDVVRGHGWAEYHGEGRGADGRHPRGGTGGSGRALGAGDGPAPGGPSVGGGSGGGSPSSPRGSPPHGSLPPQPTCSSGRRRSWRSRAWFASVWGAAASPTAPRRGRSTSTGTRWALGERTMP